MSEAQKIYFKAMLCLTMILSNMLFSEENSLTNETSIYDLTFEQLAQIQYVESSSTITEADKRHSPAAVTTIFADDLSNSGAMSLSNALEIYVPNLQLTRSVFNSLPVGMRGIINDRDEKYLMLVNGHPIHYQFMDGVQTEKMLSLMGDFYAIDVVRGPASTLYGPGALAGVINLKTHNFETFEGMDLKLSQRFIDRNSIAEFRCGKELSYDTGWFVYYGVENHLGADHDDSPVVYGNSFTANNGVSVTAGEKSPFSEPDDHRYEQVKHKVFIDYTSGSLNIWLRYNKEGEQQHGRWKFLRVDPPGTSQSNTNIDQVLEYRHNNYQTFFSSISYNWELTESLSLKCKTGYDYKRRYATIASTDNDPHFSVENKEEQLRLQSILNYEISPAHKLAIGIEGALERYSLHDYQKAHDAWNVYSLGYLAEYQWNISDYWTTFLGWRIDKHSFSGHISSPRWALIYNPNWRNTYKLMLSRAVRRANDRLAHNDNISGVESDVETLDVAEFNHQYRFSKKLSLETAVGYQIYKPVDLQQLVGSSTVSQSQVGTYDIAFLELELLYRAVDWQLSLSHSYTQLLSSNETTLVDPSLISVNDKGNGRDLAHWSNHITKLALIHELNERWKWNMSMVYYWGFPGTEDLAYYNSFDRPGGPSELLSPYIDKGYDKAFEESIYLNCGFQYKISDQTTLRCDFYNILGWLDKDYNKRMYRGLSDSYRSEAAAVGLTLHHKF